MKLLTVNMCMHVGPLQERLEALGKLVQSKRPEFIALQGVSNEIMRVVCADVGHASLLNLTTLSTNYITFLHKINALHESQTDSPLCNVSTALSNTLGLE